MATWRCASATFCQLSAVLPPSSRSAFRDAFRLSWASLRALVATADFCDASGRARSSFVMKSSRLRLSALNFPTASKTVIGIGIQDATAYALAQSSRGYRTFRRPDARRYSVRLNFDIAQMERLAAIPPAGPPFCLHVESASAGSETREPVLPRCILPKCTSASYAIRKALFRQFRRE
jgi:hypothetical protein